MVEMGKEEPLPMVTWKGGEFWEGEESIPGSETMWEVAPESITHGLGVVEPTLELLAVLLRAAMRAEQSQAGAPVPEPGPYGVAGGGGAVPNACPCRGASWVVYA